MKTLTETPKAVINEKGLFISKLTSKYLAILKTGSIKESELMSMFSLLNSDKITRDEKKEITNFIWGLNDINKCILLSEGQNLKGISYLRDQYKSPNGKERKNNPFGYREIEVLNTFTHFELIGEYDTGNAYRTHFVPLYRAVGTEGTFEYYFNGKINIIG